MCGRYVSVARLQELQDHYRATGAGDGTESARHPTDIAPTNKVYAVLERGLGSAGAGAQRQVPALRWGLAPGGAGTGHRPQDQQAEDHAIAAQRPVRQGGDPAVVAQPVRQTPGGHPRRRLMTNGCPPRTPTGSRSSSRTTSTRPTGPRRSPGCTSCGPTRPRRKTIRTDGCGRPRSSPTTPPGCSAYERPHPANPRPRTGSTCGSTRNSPTRSPHSNSSAG